MGYEPEVQNPRTGNREIDRRLADDTVDNLILTTCAYNTLHYHTAVVSIPWRLAEVDRWEPKVDMLTRILRHLIPPTTPRSNPQIHRQCGLRNPSRWEINLQRYKAPHQATSRARESDARDAGGTCDEEC